MAFNSKTAGVCASPCLVGLQRSPERTSVAVCCGRVLIWVVQVPESVCEELTRGGVDAAVRVAPLSSRRGCVRRAWYGERAVSDALRIGVHVERVDVAALDAAIVGAIAVDEV